MGEVNCGIMDIMSLRKIILRIADRPRLVFAMVELVLAVMCVLLFFTNNKQSVLSVINYILGCITVLALFLLYLRINGHKIATITMFLVMPMVTISLALWANDSTYVSMVVLPTVVLLVSLLNFKRINSRKNIVIFAVMLSVCGVVGVVLVLQKYCNLWVVVMSGFLTLMAFIIKPIIKFNGIHFSFKKYFTPSEIQKVSVVIPNYNYARYMRERVDSVLKQKYPIYELIILDDKSTDDSIAVIKEILVELKTKRPDLRVKFIPNKKNSGNVFKQWKKCFLESEGDFVWICEADDSCSKYFLNAVMSAFSDKNVVISYAESCAIDENGKRIKRDLRDWIDMFDTGHWRHSYVLDGKDELKQVLCVNNTIANVSSVVFRKKAIFAKYLDEAMKFTLAGDWYFYSKVLLNGKIAYCDESLNYHRMHDRGVTLTTDNYVHYNEIVVVQDGIGADVRLDKTAKNKIALRRRTLIDTFNFSDDEMRYIDIPLKKMLEDKKVQDEILLSIIICAYNGEKYVEDCLKSVLKGLPEKAEVIVVDDGSKDDTAEIVKKIAKENIVVKYFYKKNGGLSSAKNFGIKKATGRYVIFMDVDDKILQNGYNVMLKKAIETDADVVICDMELVYEDGKTKYCKVFHERENSRLYGFLVDGLMASSNNKMVRRKLFGGLQYPEGKNNEDVAITPVLMALAKNIQYVPSAFYKYYQRSGSIQNSRFNKNRLVVFDTCKQAIDKISEIRPDQADLISGIIISNQLIAILVYIICDMTNMRKRNSMIREFVKKYKKLDIQGNSYVKKYTKMVGMPKLEYFILNKTPAQIYAYVRRRKNMKTIERYFKRILNIKRR